VAGINAKNENTMARLKENQKSLFKANFPSNTLKEYIVFTT
jgi:hypothetical protein